MAERYKTGIVSKMMGISRQALRYYEEKQLVHSFVDEQEDNAYRYYERQDLSRLIHAKYIQSLGYSLSDVANAGMGHWDMETWQDRLERQECKIEETIRREQLVLQALQTRQKKVFALSESCGTYTLAKRPAVYYFCHSDSKENLELDNNIVELTTRMMRLFPVAEYAFLCSQYNLEHMDNLDINGLSWGIWITHAQAAENGLEIEKNLDSFPAQDCLYTVVKASAQTQATADICRGIVQEAERRQFGIAGHAMGTQLADVREEKGVAKYFEIWLPVAPK